MLSPFITYTAGTYSVNMTDRYIRADCTSGDITLNLPSNTSRKDLNFFVKKVDTSAHKCTIQVSGHNIDGISTFVLSGSTQCVWFISLASGDYESISGSTVGLTIASLGTTLGANLPSTWVPGALGPNTPTVSIPFTLPHDGDIILEVSGIVTASVSFLTASLGVKIAGTNYTLTSWNVNNGASGDYTRGVGQSGFIKVTLSAGSYTAEMIASGDGNAQILAGASIKVVFAGTGDTGSFVTIQKNDVTVDTWPIIDFIEGANTTLTMVDDVTNGRTKITVASTGGGGVDFLDEAFFSDMGILPANKIIDYEENFAAPTVPGGGGTWTQEQGALHGSSGGIAYYDLGALYSQVLIILCGKNPLTDFGLGVSDTAPTGASHGYASYDEPGGIIWKNFSSNLAAPINYATGIGQGWASYWDGTGHIQKVWRRQGFQRWWLDASASGDSTYTSFRYVYFHCYGGNARFIAPFAVWAQ